MMNFLVTDIFQGAFSLLLFAAISIQWSLHWHYLSPLPPRTKKGICVSCEGKKLRSQWSDMSGPAVSLFPFLFLSPCPQAQERVKFGHSHICWVETETGWLRGVRYIQLKNSTIFRWNENHEVFCTLLSFILKTTLKNWIWGWRPINLSHVVFFRLLLSIHEWIWPSILLRFLYTYSTEFIFSSNYCN